jgi:hypothetical protein
LGRKRAKFKGEKKDKVFAKVSGIITKNARALHQLYRNNLLRIF